MKNHHIGKHMQWGKPSSSIESTAMLPAAIPDYCTHTEK
jgi:hypothetical protein